MARRRGKYKMTPRRRAALKKAQAASARRRRFQGVKNALSVTGQVAGTVAAGAALWHLEGYARDPGKAVRHAKAFNNFVRYGRQSTPIVRKSGSINPHRIGPIRPVRNGVAGRRINNRQRRATQGRLF